MLMLLCISISNYAEDPTITMTTTKAIGETISFGFQTQNDNTTIQIDFGDGTLVDQIIGTSTTSVSGTVAGSNIAIYGNSITSLRCNENFLTFLDISNSTNLIGLYCTNNSLMSIDMSNNSALILLDCSYNSLPSIDVSSNSALAFLRCCYNSFQSIDVSNNSALTYLDCSNNSLLSIDVSNNTNLTSLSCTSCNLSSLDVTNNMDLTSLSCGLNNLTSLDASNNTNLTWLSCSSNSLTSLDISNNTNLTKLYCYSNSLTSLYVSNNTELTTLSCFTNSLTAIDISKNTNLTTLSCSTNSLTSLDISNNTNLRSLYCDDNSLSTLDVSNNTELEILKCQNNKLTFASLPITYIYEYAPQANFEIIDNVIVGGTIDLSSQYSINSNITNYAWKTESGTWLTEGEDYEIINGVTTFLKSQSEPVYCEMSNASFPDFTGDDIFKTTLTNVTIANGIDEATETINTKIYSSDNSIIVKTDTQSHITVFDISGKIMADKYIGEGVNSISGINNGVYIVKVGNNNTPIVEKVVVQ